MSDDLLRALRDLPAEPPPPALDARVLRKAHEELRRQLVHSWAALAWTRVALPAALAATVVGYLHWAIAQASALYR